jgi:hypothetical protein
MPRIIVQADPSPGSEALTVLQERVTPSDFQSMHFAMQLLERINWAVGDAKQAELEHGDLTVDRALGSEQRRFVHGAERSDAERRREPALAS